jgi:alpha-tubulin suppressor-like RCC1 family protein
MAACGVDLTVAVTEDGELLAWGHLGLGAVLTDLQTRMPGREL